MPESVVIGRKKNDFGFFVDFHKKRAMVRANTGWIDGTALEIIPAGPSGYYQAMVLIKRDWRDIYFLTERAAWSEDDYFRYAEKRQKELGITRP